MSAPGYHGTTTVVNTHSPLQVARRKGWDVSYAKGCEICDVRPAHYPNEPCRISASEAKHGGRRQHHQPRSYVKKVQATGSEQLKALIGEPERWAFETLTEEEIARTTAAEPLWPDGRPDALLASRDDARASKL